MQLKKFDNKFESESEGEIKGREMEGGGGEREVREGGFYLDRQ